MLIVWPSPCATRIHNVGPWIKIGRDLRRHDIKADHACLTAIENGVVARADRHEHFGAANLLAKLGGEGDAGEIERQRRQRQGRLGFAVSVALTMILLPSTIVNPQSLMKSTPTYVPDWNAGDFLRSAGPA